MKTAVSIPDEVFARAEALAHRMHRSRSEVYATALLEYLARIGTDDITDTLNRVVAEAATTAGPDVFVRTAARATLERTEW